jgi:hypothetical protein
MSASIFFTAAMIRAFRDAIYQVPLVKRPLRISK